MLTPGDPLPWLRCTLLGGASFSLSGAAGRPVVLTYLASAGNPASQAVMAGFDALESSLGDALHLIASCDPSDEREGRLTSRPPNRLVLMDLQRQLAVALGVLQPPRGSAPASLRPASFLLDPALRVLAALPIQNPTTHASEVAAHLSTSPAADDRFAPVLLLPRVLDPDLCRAMITYYDAGDPRSSGVYLNRTQGAGALVVDERLKTRKDLLLDDPALRAQVQDQLTRRLLPELQRTFYFRALFIERYLLGCYTAEDAGWFAPHRDNQDPQTAHRQFACSFNLNAEDYEGGDVHFPEYGPRGYRAPTGGALVFSCALMHAVSPVTRGRRIALLPFLYGQEGKHIRDQNHPPE